MRNRNQLIAVAVIGAMVLAAMPAQAATITRTEGEDRYEDAPAGECNNESPSNLTVSGASGGKVVILPYNACWVKLSTANINNAAVLFGTYQPGAAADECFQLDVYTMGQADLYQGSSEQHCGNSSIKRVQVLNTGSVQHFSGNPMQLKVKGTRVTGANSLDMGIDYIEYVSGATVREAESRDRTSGSCVTTGASSISMTGTDCWAEWDRTLPANALRVEFRARITTGIGLDAVTLGYYVDGVLKGTTVVDNRNWITYLGVDVSTHDVQHTVTMKITAAAPSSTVVEIDWLQWPH